MPLVTPCPFCCGGTSGPTLDNLCLLIFLRNHVRQGEPIDFDEFTGTVSPDPVWRALARQWE